jgi:hypothetical protein
MLWLGLILLPILILALAAIVFFYMQIKKGKGSEERPTGIKEVSSLGECARCKQHRIIVKKEAGLCAACWSSINTKQIG